MRPALPTGDPPALDRIALALQLSFFAGWLTAAGSINGDVRKRLLDLLHEAASRLAREPGR